MDKIKIEIKKCVFTRHGDVEDTTFLGLLKNNNKIINHCYSNDISYIINFFKKFIID